MSKSTVAVIISTYNAPGYLRRVLQGYAQQRCLPDELLVADDGSTPDTAAVVAEIAAAAPFPVRHVWHEDRGFRLAEIRNRAIAAAVSDYLIFSDGDCVPHPRFVDDHRRMMRPGWFVTGKRMLVGRELSPEFNWTGTIAAARQCLKSHLSGGHHLLRLPWLAHERKGVMGLRGCNMAMYRADALAVNGYNEQITGWGREDSELVARLFAYGLRRREAPFAAIVFHLWHPENSRNNLAENDRLLQEAIRSGNYRCSCGVSKDAHAGAES